ncbi:MAG: sulfatase-like hydrolase/transferase [Candidatus Brocadiae bacterium]|nr:sulfatase-like hydrolase/transferase [Candidatus Brocadiia bacterium]
MPDDRPNILFLTTDQQRFDCLGINSGGTIHTPHLDALARHGANLRGFFVNNAVCMPSRASLLTGRYPQNHGVGTNGIPLPETETTIAHALGQAGYTTANLGKLHFLPHVDRDHTAPHPSYGFDVHVNSDEPGCYPDAYIRWLRQVAPEMEQKCRVPRPSVEPRSPLDQWVFEAPEELSHTAWVADRTIEFIHQQGERPWFAIAGFYPPHPPCNAPQHYLDLYPTESIPPPLRREGEMADKPRMFQRMAQHWANVTDEQWLECRRYYYAMCSLVDAQCGRIIETLRERGQLDNTLIVYYSDHGDLRGDHGLVSKHPSNYDGIIHVPCFLRWPGHIPAGRLADGLVEGVDLMPTVLEAVGADIPAGVKGTSAWALAAGETDAGRDSVLVEHKVPGAACIKTLRTRAHKYWLNDQGEEVLFDLDADPDEFVNVARDPAYASVRSSVRGRLLERLIHAADDLPGQIAPY